MAIKCEHENVVISADPTAFEDTNVVVLRLAVHCEQCKMRFRFVGVDEGTGLRTPTSINDGIVALMPIIGVGEVPRYDFSRARN